MMQCRSDNDLTSDSVLPDPRHSSACCAVQASILFQNLHECQRVSLAGLGSLYMRAKHKNKISAACRWRLFVTYPSRDMQTAE